MPAYVPPHLRNKQAADDPLDDASNGAKLNPFGAAKPAGGDRITPFKDTRALKKESYGGIKWEAAPLKEDGKSERWGDVAGYDEDLGIFKDPPPRTLTQGAAAPGQLERVAADGAGKYIPPALRGKMAADDDARAGAVGLGNADHHQPRGRSGWEGAGASGEDWWQRRDGRRVNGWEPSEYEVFGNRKQTVGINFDDYDKVPVKVSGREQTFTKIDAFADPSRADLCKSLVKNLERCGYKKPTPVQKYSIPLVISGRDVMACAQTGSGKTCAFMVPAIECLLRSGPPSMPSDANSKFRRMAAPCAVVMAPTRELATQIYEEARKFSFYSGIRCCVVYGGADIREQRRELGNGCDVIVATPGRLHDMHDRGILTLAFIQFLILDEADRMLDMGFEPQVRKIIEQTDMGKMASHARQSMMFSATFPKEVQFMARDFLYDYIFLAVGRVGSATELVTQHVVYADDREKVKVLEDVIYEHLPNKGLALIFVETKKGADSLEKDMWNRGLRPTTIHGDRSQHEREQALHSFRSGRTNLLIATDVASRGLDIPNVNLVVNYDMPKAIEDYVHRIGRTGRAGNRGTAVALVNDQCQPILLRDLQDNLWEGQARAAAKSTAPKICAFQVAAKGAIGESSERKL
eukprot:TRINITY_DN12966_c0_g1_i2.p1 TRINITY_DN12966_c0_g1~~TRINITY_DN12966_c0_g1_i2.p1  ORF type:complete len:635 (+),score=108.29 TRINITY_DN12966_c0_g1_i2:173-2077(+)